MSLGDVRFGALLWLMRTGWDEVEAAALSAEAAGFDSIWVSDHLLAKPRRALEISEA